MSGRSHLQLSRRRTGANRPRWLLLLFLAASAIALISCQRQEQPSVATRPSTGFTVQEPFTGYYERYGPQLLGEPITGACEVASGGVAQYFQRARLQVGAGGKVSFYPLGEWAYAGIRRVVEAPVPDNSRQRLFPETGFRVRDQFLAFYEENSGESLLGPPLSQQLEEGQMRVQYFRNGRLEWHPEAPPQERVRVGLLGQAHYLQAAHDVICEFRARPVDVNAVENVHLLASAEAPILFTGEEQVIYAMVTTPAGVPVSDVPVEITLRDTDWTLTVDLGHTDQEGKVQGGLQMPRFEPGHLVGVRVEAQSVDGRTLGRTGLAFQTWW